LGVACPKVSLKYRPGKEISSQKSKFENEKKVLFTKLSLKAAYCRDNQSVKVTYSILPGIVFIRI